MEKLCPHHNVVLEQALLAAVEVDYCPVGYGMWFEEGELAQAKDNRDRDLRWLDIDLWARPERFRLSLGTKLSPATRLPMYETRYGDSTIVVDVDNVSHGVWLDRGEFRDIMGWLKEESAGEILDRYVQNVAHELWEVYSGPEMLREELQDLLVLLKLLRYKFAVQHPLLSEALAASPK